MMIWMGRYIHARAIRLSSRPLNWRTRKRGLDTMKNRINKKVVTAAILSVLIVALLCTSAFAASYSKTYGRTKDRLRVRASASSSATVIDNILKDACVYISTSSTSGASTFVKVTYRNKDGNIDTGWVCQHDGDETLVSILSAAQAESQFGVKSGNLPSRKVGTFTASERAAAERKAASDAPASTSGSYTKAYVQEVQSMLKELGYYYGEVTGNIGNKTENAIEEFQRKNGLSADGIPGPNTYAKLQSVYGSKGGSTSSSGGGLRLNSTGTDVRNLQQDLTTLGYYWAEVTGNFGEKTRDAVKRFQEKNDLTADGVAGTDTLNAINAALKRGGYSSSSTVPTGTSLSLNMKNDAVLSMQKALAALGYYDGEFTGNFGPKTETAVKAFQRAKGISADGIAGPQTLQAINSASKSSGSSTGATLRKEDTGDLVRALQRDLAALGYYTGEVTGHFGDKTKTAVAKFQRSRNLRDDGVAGPDTQNAIIAALGNSGSLASSGGGSGSSASGTLKNGDEGDVVRDMQQRLTKLGYYYGEITGSFGDLTERAVRKFQDESDLTVDGKAGPKTLQALYARTGGSYTGTANGTVSGIKYGTLNTDNVSLRESYSKSAKSVVELDRGKALKITETVNVNGQTWYYCTAEKGNYTYKGYVNSTYVTVGSYNDFIAGGGDEISLGGEVLGMIRVTGNKVSIREDHDDDSDRIGYAYKGDVYYYISTRSYDDGWFQISSGGWISQKYATRLTETEMDAYGGSTSNQTSYRKGDKGSMVKWIQEALDELDYYDGEITGSYGNKTHDAVQDFQRDHDLSGDGIAGPKTILAIQEALGNKIGSTGSNLITGKIVYNLDWFKYKNYLTSNSHFGINTYKNTSYKAMLTDIQTGKTLDIKIQSTGNHIDAEPWDSRDTQVLASLYGKSSGSDLVGVYKRRPMILTTKKGANVLVSIYPEPHGDDTVANNDYDGQFCLHMVNSKTHGTDRVDDDVNGHQEMLRKGAALLKDKGYTVLTSYDGNGVKTGATVVDPSLDVNTSTGTTTVTPPPSTLHPNTYVYSVDAWGEYHVDENCTKLVAAGFDTTAEVTSIRKLYKDVKPADNKLCTSCKPVWVYFGDTSTANYHYSDKCPNLLSMGYTSLYVTTESFIKHTSRTHVCGHCSKTGISSSTTITVPTVEVLSSTPVYYASDWAAYCTNAQCKDLVNYVVDTLGKTAADFEHDYKDIPSNLKGKECTTCKSTWVYYGNSQHTYHYSLDCSELRERGYSKVYSTTQPYAKHCGIKECTKCKK